MKVSKAAAASKVALAGGGRANERPTPRAVCSLTPKGRYDGLRTLQL